MVRNPSDRSPIHPGVILRDKFLIPLGISQHELANTIHVPYQRINEIVNGPRGITPSTALRLEKYFGNTASFWLNLQLRHDLYAAHEAENEEIEEIQPLQDKHAAT